MHRLLSLLLVLSAALANASDHCEPLALNILLTNDDGYQTPGIVALHRALKAAGHNVKRVAPERNYSGSSASLTMDVITAPRMPNEEFSEIYAVTASPATTVLLGATAIFGPDQPVDLVVSGINDGANLGPATAISGTVGATTAALKALVPPIPGIAISTNPINEEAGSVENQEHVANIAEFTSRLVTALHCGSKPWSTGNLALNVNYPPLAPQAIKGVRIAAQGQAPYYAMGFRAVADNHYAPDFKRAAPSQDIDDSDTFLFRQGYITIVPIDADFTAGGASLPGGLTTIEP
jgi:5'-nucleotidase